MRAQVSAVLLTLVLLSPVIPADAGWNPFSKGDDKEKKAREEEKERGKAIEEAGKTVKAFKKVDADLERLFESAAGYAVFPTIGKGGIGIGGAYGKGVVYEDGKPVGKTSVKQVTVGFQLGGQTYSELIFFKDEDSLKAFKNGNFEFSAQVSAIAAAAGASKDAPYERGVAVFTLAGKGLMYEASVGGQKFGFEAFED